MSLHSLIATRHGLTPKSGRAANREWVLFYELRNGTGFQSQDRSVDAFAMNCWPSKGFLRVAYEVKHSRQDFLRELKDPAKRQWGMEVSNEFWFVVAHGVCDKTEVPEDCGLLVATKDEEKLRVAKQAPHRACRDFRETEIASIARHGFDYAPFASARFKLSGRDLSAEDLSAIVRDEMDDEMRRMSVEIAETIAEKRLLGVRDCLSRYAKEMRAGGIAPPKWMEDGNLASAAHWDAQLWVRNDVLGRSGADVVRRAELAVNNALSALNRVKAELSAANTQEKS